MTRPVPPTHLFRYLSAAERGASLEDARARGPAADAFWVFAYGSLMWNPPFCVADRRAATLVGYRRRFGIWTIRARGTAANPGLGLCLESAPGHACQGLAYRLDAAELDRDLGPLWEREMVTGVYAPHWLPVDTGAGAVVSLCFVSNPAHPQFAPSMALVDMAEIIAAAHGHNGSCRDYLAHTVAELAALDVVDDELNALLALVDARRQQALE